MGYQIEACIQQGKPSLKIYNAEDRSLCLSWTYEAKRAEPRSEQEIHRLFRELLLLTCKQDLHNVRTFNLSNMPSATNG